MVLILECQVIRVKSNEARRDGMQVYTGDLIGYYTCFYFYFYFFTLSNSMYIAVIYLQLIRIFFSILFHFCGEYSLVHIDALSDSMMNRVRTQRYDKNSHQKRSYILYTALFRTFFFFIFYFSSIFFLDFSNQRNKKKIETFEGGTPLFPFEIIFIVEYKYNKSKKEK